MSREELRNFVNTAEKSFSAKEKLVQCRTAEDLILLAKEYGYSITLEDLKHDLTATKFDLWFKESRIDPLNFTR